MDAPPEKSTAREIVEGAIEGAVGMVPIAGNPLAVAFAMSMGWAYNKRMQAWHRDLAEAVTELQQAVEGWPSFDELAEDDVFVDAVIHASRAAQATHQEEKLAALRNGVLNSLGPDAPTADEQARFFRLVEEFTRSHLRLLTFFDNPGELFDAAGIGRPQLMSGGRAYLLNALPEFAQLGGWVDLLAGDLATAVLTNHGGLHATQSGDSLWQSTTTPLGRRFLAFIREPAAIHG